MTKVVRLLWPPALGVTGGALLFGQTFGAALGLVTGLVCGLWWSVQPTAAEQADRRRFDADLLFVPMEHSVLDRPPGSQEPLLALFTAERPWLDPYHASPKIYAPMDFMGPRPAPGPRAYSSCCRLACVSSQPSCSPASFR